MTPLQPTWTARERPHQVPLANARDTEEHLKDLETWLTSYRPEELFDDAGALREDLRVQDFRDYAVDVEEPGSPITEVTRRLGKCFRDVIAMNPENFRVFGHDETASNRLPDVDETPDKQWNAEFRPTADDSARRRPIASFNHLLSFHVRRQDHNGSTTGTRASSTM